MVAKHTPTLSRLLMDAAWQAQNAANISARARENLFSAINLGPEEWASRAISDQQVSAQESAKARAKMEVARAAISKSAPSCPYCGTTSDLRQVHNGGGHEAPEYTCEGCFTPRVDGPCFDDLPMLGGSNA